MGQNNSNNNYNNTNTNNNNNNNNIDNPINQLREQDKPQPVLIVPSTTKLYTQLCYIDKDDSGEIIELKFGNKNYQEMLQSQFIQFLDQNSNKQIKIITTFGESGQGKSFIQNFLIQNYEQNQKCQMIFPCDQNTESQTKGINYYFIEDKEDTNQLTILFDCEGFDFSDQSAHMKNLQKLICLITRISTCVFYVHQNSRKPKGLDEIFKLINANEQNGSTFHNFYEIINKWNGEKKVSYQEIPNYSKKISEVFYLKSLSFEEKKDQENYISKIQNDDSFKQFIEEINKITKQCKNSNYKTSFANCKAFESDQSCKSFKDMLLCSFQSIQEKIEVSLALFITIINQQKMITDSLNESYYKWKQDFERKLDQVITQNQALLTDETKERIIKQYSNLESVKPEELKINELLQQKKENKESFNLFFEIFKLIFRILFPSFTVLETIFQFPNILYQLFRKNNNQIQKNLKNKIIQYCQEGRLMKGKCTQNIQLLRQMVTEIEQLNNKEDDIVFLIFINITHSSVLEYKNLLNTFEIDNLVLQSCIQKFREDNRIQELNFQLVLEQQQINISNNDFKFLQTQQEIVFQNEILISKSQNFLINQDLFLSFICQSYFYEKIYSKEFAEKICDKEFMNQVLSIQKQII
ncbi:hypothetical protein ABPG74_003105 [Tetrahymena malaccensis]